ncbi:MAG: pyrroloquinoline quinone biosynthesis protein PqqE [Myxococcota bacterium]
MSGAGGTRLVLSAHAALKTRRQGDVLVLPERAIRLGGSGGEILRFFDRARTAAEVAAALAARYPASEGLEPEVQGFVAQMLRVGALVEAGTKAFSAGGAAASGRAASASAARASAAPTPLNLIAELTYRCPLQCPYCSNPIDFRSRREALDAADWGRVFEQAAELGVVHLGLTGGEPSTRSDLEDILARAVDADLYPHLVTAGRPLTPARLEAMAERGLKSVQVSLQAVDAERSDRIAGTPSFEEKLAIARRTTELGLALTINCVLHRQNLDQVPRLIELSIELGASRLELANTQFHNWALRNRAALMPSQEQLETASAAVAAARPRAEACGLAVLFVRPDYYSGRPKPCMGGWGRLALVVDPTGLVLPCHEAADLPGLEFWRVPDRTLEDAWESAPGMQAYRGTAWMSEPCRSCPERERDFGGCRCQAFRLLGDASKTDPACSLSPDHALVIRARDERTDELVYRR